MVNFSPSLRTTWSRKRAVCGLVLAGAVLAVAGCGGSASHRTALAAEKQNELGTPLWAPDYRGLAKRLVALKLPTGDSERFHIHALLTIYDRGVLVTVPSNIGIDDAKDIESTLHTHDATGIIHMEGPRPYPYTLGDFFAVWGVPFGARVVGSLEAAGPDRVWVYVNGHRIGDPARHVLAKDDIIVIGYGTRDSFPHTVSTGMLEQVESGRTSLPCSVATPSEPSKPCLAPKGRRRAT